MASVRAVPPGPTKAANNRPELPLSSEPISISDAGTRGSSTAKLALIIFSDFQCPFSRRFALDTLPDLERDYVATGRLLLAFKHLPIEKIHPRALRAAEAVECARREGRFWEMHDHLFADPGNLADAFAQNAATVGLSDGFTLCLNGASKFKVQAEVADAARYGITATPGFLIGQIRGAFVKPLKRLSGALPLSEFRATLDQGFAAVVGSN
jgi:protein-disulfide isomerase